MKAVEKNIYYHKNGFVVRKYNEYVGYYKDLEDAKRARDSVKPKPKEPRYKVTIEGLPERLNKCIGESGKNIAQITRELSLPHCGITKYVSGENVPSALSLVKMAVYFGVSTDWLLGLSKEEKA